MTTSCVTGVYNHITCHPCVWPHHMCHVSLLCIPTSHVMCHSCVRQHHISLLCTTASPVTLVYNHITCHSCLLPHHMSLLFMTTSYVTVVYNHISCNMSLVYTHTNYHLSLSPIWIMLYVNFSESGAIWGGIYLVDCHYYLCICTIWNLFLINGDIMM